MIPIRWVCMTFINTSQRIQSPRKLSRQFDKVHCQTPSNTVNSKFIGHTVSVHIASEKRIYSDIATTLNRSSAKMISECFFGLSSIDLRTTHSTDAFFTLSGLIQRAYI